MLRDNVIIDRNEKQFIIGKEAYNLKSNKNYRNNDLLLQQPVPVKPAVTLGQGIVYSVISSIAIIIIIIENIIN